MTRRAPDSSRKPGWFANPRTLRRAGIALLCVLLAGLGTAALSRYATSAAPTAPPAASTTAAPATTVSVSPPASVAPVATPPTKAASVVHARAPAASVATPAPAATGAAPQANTITSAAAPSLDDIEHRTFEFFWQTANPENGLVPDHWPLGKE